MNISDVEGFESCGLENLPSDLKRMLRIQGSEFLYMLNDADVESKVLPLFNVIKEMKVHRRYRLPLSA